MPAAIPAVVTAVGAFATGASVSLGFIALTGWQAALAIGAASFALSSLQSRLAPKNKGGQNALSDSMTVQFNDPVGTHKIVYGEARVSGTLLFAASTQDNTFLHQVIVLAAHEVEEIGEVWLGDYSIPPDHLDGSGNVTQGRYAGKVRIKKHLGADDQTADSNLVAEVSQWTVNHRVQGRAYIYVRFEKDRNVFPNGNVNISAYVRGKKLYDPRTETTYWTPNAALMSYDFVTSSRYGLKSINGTGNVDDDAAMAAANICEEYVETGDVSYSVAAVDAVQDMLSLNADLLHFQFADRVEVTSSGVLPAGLSANTSYYVIPYQRKTTPRIRLAASFEDCIAGIAVDITDGGTGVHTVFITEEPRYFGGGVIDTSNEVGRNFMEILSAMAGKPAYTGGKWMLFPGAYRTPTITLDEDSLRGSIKVIGRKTITERFNSVQGIYANPVNYNKPSDYPVVSNGMYVTADGGEEIYKDLPLPMTQRSKTAQRIAKIALEESRQEIMMEMPCNLSALRLRAGDTVLVNNARMGFSAKPFEIKKWAPVFEGDANAPVMGIDLILQETATGVYDWNQGEETRVDLSPDTNLPDPFTVTVVSGFSLDSILVDTQGGDRTYKVIASWQPHENRFVTEGGYYKVEWKASEDATYISNAIVDGADTQVQIPQLSPDTYYDIRIIAYTKFRSASQPTTINNFVVGTTVTTNTEDWENGTIGTRDGQDWENDSLTSEDFEA